VDWLSNKIITAGLVTVFLITLFISQPVAFSKLFSFVGVSVNQEDPNKQMVTPTLVAVPPTMAPTKVRVTSDTNLVSPSPTATAFIQLVSPTPVVTPTTPVSSPIPSATPPTPVPAPVVPASPSNLININTAGLSELDKITGIGPVYAQRIIDYRQANGPFQKTEDLKKVKGIGDITFLKMKDEITVGP